MRGFKHRVEDASDLLWGERVIFGHGNIGHGGGRGVRSPHLIYYVLPPGKGNLVPTKAPRIPKKRILVSKPVLVSGGRYRTSKKSTLSQHWSALNMSGN